MFLFPYVYWNNDNNENPKEMDADKFGTGREISTAVLTESNLHKQKQQIGLIVILKDVDEDTAD